MERKHRRLLPQLLTLLIFLLQVVFVSEANEFEISEDVKHLVTEIAQINVVKGSAVGAGGVRPKQYDNFVELKATASIRELELLSKHSNSVVRTYALWALTAKPDINHFKLLKDQITDTAQIKTQFGCILGSETVADFLIARTIHGSNEEGKPLLSSSQKEAVDMLLLYTPNQLNATSNMLTELKLSQKHYSRIRELVIEGQHQEALVVLAKYQNNNDIELILKHANMSDKHPIYAYKAMAAFPSPTFFPWLKQQVSEELKAEYWGTDWRYLYKALAAYQHYEAFDLLARPLDTTQEIPMREYHLRAVFSAIHKYKDGFYDNLLWQLWRDYHFLNTDILRHFLGLKPQLAYRLLKQDLYNIETIASAFNSISMGYGTNETSLLVNLMLDEVFEREYEQGVAIVKHNILVADILSLRIFSEKASTIQDPLLIEPLLARTATDSNPHVYLATIKALLSFNDASINQQILALRERNKHLNEGWGSESLDKLLMALN